MKSVLPSDRRRKKPQGFSSLLTSRGTTYLSHFGFQEKPFNIIPDPKFLWLGERHKEALERLRHEILHRDGYVVIRGDVGTGKSTLANILLNELKSHATPAKVSCPNVGYFDVLKLAASAHKLNASFSGQVSLLATFESFLRESFSGGKRPILIFDEAQRLTLENLTELWHLSNLGENGTQWLNLVLVGQNDLNDILSQESHRAFREREIFNYNLPPLTLEETKEYVFYRLKIARGESEIPTLITRDGPQEYSLRRLKDAPEEILTTEALREVFLISMGIPRLINNICDLALLDAYLEGRKIILPQNVKKCAQRYQLSIETAGSGGKGPGFSYPMERKPGGEKGGEIWPEPCPQTVREKSGRRFWVSSFCSTAGLFLFFFAILFLFYKSAPLLQNLIYPVFKEVSWNDLVRSTREAGNLSAKGPHALLPSAAGDPASSERLGSNFKVFGPQEVSNPNPPGQSTTPEEISVGGIETERLGAADSGAPPETAKRASTEPWREEKRQSEKKESFIKHNSAALKEKKERVNQSPLLTAERTLPEPTAAKAEEIEPGRVIEWLLERKSHKNSGGRSKKSWAFPSYP
jgi:type II secretory pathway predicted ATPase ExeA